MYNQIDSNLNKAVEFGENEPDPLLARPPDWNKVRMHELATKLKHVNEELVKDDKNRCECCNLPTNKAV